MLNLADDSNVETYNYTIPSGLKEGVPAASVHYTFHSVNHDAIIKQQNFFFFYSDAWEQPNATSKCDSSPIGCVDHKFRCR